MAPETEQIQAPAAAEKPLRRDAERNRRLILEAAKQLFAERGPNVTLDDIAARAEVGVGTVYRRFADRDTLIDALFTDRIQELVDLAESAFAIEDPWDGLVAFMEGHMRMQAADRSFAAVAMSDLHGLDAVLEAKARLQPLATRIIQRAVDAKVVRPDLAVTDVPLLVLMLGAALDATRDLAPDAWERYFAIVLDGLRPGCCTPLVTSPITVDQVPEVMRCGMQRRS